MSKRDGNKNIKRVEDRKGSRVKPHEAPRIDFETRGPSFSLHRLERGKYGLEGCSKDQKSAILDALLRRSQLSWRELRQAPRHGLGYEKIAHNSIKTGIPNHVTPDTTLLAFRCIGTAPMVGYKEEDRFHIVWFDLDYTLYDHDG